MDSSLSNGPSRGLRRRDASKSSSNIAATLTTDDHTRTSYKGSSRRVFMNKGSFLPIMLLFMLLFAMTIFLTASQSTNQAERSEAVVHMRGRQESSPCFVYFAPSSVSGGGMGIFTTKPIREGEVILSSDGPSIPVIDPDRSKESNIAWVGLFKNYWWGSGVAQSASFEADNVVEFQTGVGGLPNSHGYLNNIRFENAGLVPFDDSRFDRAVDPGAGAITYSTGRKTIARIDMDAGEEFFMRYPEHYMNHISKKYNIPEHRDYEEVGKLVTFLSQKYGMDPHNWEDAEELSDVPSRALPLLPKSMHEMKRIALSANRSKDPSNLALAVAKEMSVEKRSVEWIKEHGVCLDNFAQRKSTNPQAGQGAFAKRFIKKGEVIAPAPILHITDRDALRMPAFRGDKQQLLLNYCIGHEYSSMLLCPNTNANLINHCSKRRPEIHPCGRRKGHNARFRWAEWDEVSNDWRSKTPEQMKKEGGKGLTLEVVATRNIYEGEEVFIDYGVNFEKAWDEHVLKWESSHDKDNQEPISAKQLNDEMAPLRLAPDFTADFISTDSRGVLFTGCHYNEGDESFWDEFNDGEPWEDMPIGKVINRYGNSYGDEFDIEDESSHGPFWPCVVARQEQIDGEDAYIVRIIQLKSMPTTIWERMKLPRIIRHFPRESIRHFNLPYSSDVHLPGAFRHHIEMDDDIFPDAWKNRLP